MFFRTTNGASRWLREDCQNGESEAARFGSDCRVWQATHLSDLSDQICGECQKSPGRKLFAYTPSCGPLSMQG